jgi:hypothetical protein
VKENELRHLKKGYFPSFFTKLFIIQKRLSVEEQTSDKLFVRSKVCKQRGIVSKPMQSVKLVNMNLIKSPEYIGTSLFTLQ